MNFIKFNKIVKTDLLIHMLMYVSKKMFVNQWILKVLII